LAKARGLELSAFFARTRDEIAPALDAAKAAGAGAINVLAGQLFYFNRQQVIERVQELRLPAIYQLPEWAEQGGLIGYGSRFEDLYPIQARQLVEILRGTALADIPIEQPTKFELAINLKTAKALGVEIPPTLLASADQIVE
jgi:putative ABC transport system substrate-binding protein